MKWFLVGCLAFACHTVHATDVHEATIVIQDHRFVPSEVAVPADRKIKLTVVNKDSTPEEFESYELVGPLKPGRYPFFGEFHMETAKAVLIAE